MTEAATIMPHTGDPTPIAPADESSRTFVRQVIDAVLGSAAARFGLAWIGVLVILAVFGPFLANSHPLLLKQAGRWSSPLLHHLDAADAILQITFWSAGIIYFLPMLGSAKRRWIIWLSLTLLLSFVLPFVVHAPQVVVYERYREAQQAGKIERAVYALIP